MTMQETCPDCYHTQACACNPKEFKRIETLDIQLAEARAEVARLREVLEFYADENNYVPQQVGHPLEAVEWEAPPMSYDIGQSAREALASERE